MTQTLRQAETACTTYSVNHIDVDIAASVGVGVFMIEWQGVLIDPVQRPGSIILNVCGADTPVLVYRRNDILVG